MEQIQVTARFPQIAKENLDEFKRLAGDALKVTSEDPGVPQYDWFFSQDESHVRRPGDVRRLGGRAGARGDGG